MPSRNSLCQLFKHAFTILVMVAGGSRPSPRPHCCRPRGRHCLHLPGRHVYQVTRLVLAGSPLLSVSFRFPHAPVPITALQPGQLPVAFVLVCVFVSAAGLLAVGFVSVWGDVFTLLSFWGHILLIVLVAGGCWFSPLWDPSAHLSPALWCLLVPCSIHWHGALWPPPCSFCCCGHISFSRGHYRWMQGPLGDR